MSYSDFGPHRRSRRRRNVIVLITVLVIVGVLALAVRYRTERRESIDYLSTAEEVALQHAEMADFLGVLFQGLGQEDRPAVELRLDTLALDASEARARLDELVVTRPVAETSGLMTVAVSAWGDGVVTLKNAIIAVLDAEENDLTADEELRAAFEMLRLGDRAYEMVIASVAELDPEIVPMDFPEVKYTTGDYSTLYKAEVIAERLRRLGGLSESRDLAISATTIPEPASEGVGGIRIIPASDEIALEVTVSNTGNVLVELVTLTVTLQRVGGVDDPIVLRQVIPAIESPGSEVRLFENLPAEPGVVYNITAVASLNEGDDLTEDNTFMLVFERNAE
ncbi:MAG: hypothetical protein QNL12_04985 [Acidimicrobiia bacterium]|nr:hypothetical protein [Acidimicrobiia bacterium]MDX2466645.1 hypothetical protein [Acidimicrobiia bacterium]